MSGKMVCVYSVKKEQIMIDEHAVNLEFMKFTPSRSRAISDYSGGRFDEAVKMERWPIVEFRSCSYGDWPFMERPDITPKVERSFIAIEPELERLVSVKHEAKISEMAQKSGNLQFRINKWNSKKWYSKLFDVFTGKEI